jgi:hypothetical protein
MQIVKMNNLKFTTGMLIFSLFSVPSFGQDNKDWPEGYQPMRTASLTPRFSNNSSLLKIHDRFLGCVYSSHQCEHLAHGQRYTRHYVRHDHDRCHHGPSYACYAE